MSDAHYALTFGMTKDDMARIAQMRRLATSDKHFDAMLQMQIDWRIQCNRGVLFAPPFKVGSNDS